MSYFNFVFFRYYRSINVNRDLNWRDLDWYLDNFLNRSINVHWLIYINGFLHYFWNLNSFDNLPRLIISLNWNLLFNFNVFRNFNNFLYYSFRTWNNFWYFYGYFNRLLYDNLFNDLLGNMATKPFNLIISILH